ncbi:MAG: hypothetical protein IJ447_02015 [Clostridia bacterium]|nr:hypothetical protein [Clostridia bacterium]
MEYDNKYEVALFVMCRQRLVHLGAVIGKSPQEVDVAAYRAMQDVLNDEDVISSAVEYENAKRIAEVYG